MPIEVSIEFSSARLLELSEALARARRGDEDGIRVLYRWLNPPLLRYLRHHAGAIGEDLASEVWLAVARGLAGVEGGPVELRAYVFTVARRRVVDHRRRQARRLVTVPIGDFDDPPTPDDTEGLGLERATGQQAVEMLVRDLPPEQREIVLLRVLGGLSVAEVASILGKSAGAVRVAQHRALQRLSRRPSETGVTN